ncbi:hypothetical protein ACFYXH_02060 [Streptomyces sp. NPDC002730]|uniref:hypothetical protein n=1 Tax=Streptomyces sp. NPDC002730 TaxID=3364662 RepID=UPI0036CD62C6
MDEPDEAAQRLAVVCANAEAIRARLCGGPTGDDAVLEEVLSAARGGGETDRALDVLHAVLQALGDAQGLHAYSKNGRTADRGVYAAGVDRDGLGEPVFLCPSQRCARYWWPQGPVPAPRCAISGDALRRERL